MKNNLFTFLFLISFNGFSQVEILNLMPWPQEISIGTAKNEINSDFTIAVNNRNSKRIEIASTKFLQRLSNRTGVFLKNEFPFIKNKIKNPSLDINYQTIGKLAINQDESYQLKVTSNKITIDATTDIGVIYALETLLQLLDNNETSFYFPEVIINDFPRFTWRGLMIDVARHYEPLDVLKRNLDAMASVKLNVFHWHLTDDQGFRIESKTHPKLHEFGSDGLYYTQEEIKEIVAYAGDRGIRVVPEVDVPGHATAILAAYPEIGSKNITYAIEKNSGIFDPTLDPTNERTYEILGDLFGEMATLFPDSYFHIGGDENEGKHWDENQKIQEFKKKNNLETNHHLQTFFNIRLEKILQKHQKLLMGWEEIMTDKMPKTALIHSWKGKNEGVIAGHSLITAAKNGYNAILSNGYYIDLMLPVSEHYVVDPLPDTANLSSEEKSRILGGEATMWSELVTPLTIDSRIWPRTAAIAERFWSSTEIKDISNMHKRLENISFRLEDVGITHIRNRDVILRTISNNQNLEALVELTKVYEPVKIYSRNENGTEYKTFSPFTLFADACTADASEALLFNNLTKKYIGNPNPELKKQLINLLNKWIKNYELFSQYNTNPILNNIRPLSKNLSENSKLILKVLQMEKINNKDHLLIRKNIAELEKPVVDVEFASVESFKLIIDFYSKKQNANRPR